MTYPKFFDKIETIKLQDDLASFLGAFENGIIEFSYLDLVKTAGHSCPTVLGAYLMTKEALKALYPNDIAKRGEIKVEFNERQTEGVAGVIANVIQNITGACSSNGFKGLAGNFDRNYLMQFEKEISGANVKFTRADNKKSVNVFYNLASITADPRMQTLMQKCIQGSALEDEKLLFAQLWQNRVEYISLNISKVIRVEEL